MNEQVKEMITVLGDKLISYLNTAESIAINNAPALVQEVYSYYLTIGWICTISFGVILLGMVVAYIVWNINNTSETEEWVLSLLVLFVAGTIPTLLFGYGLITILKIYTAPKLFLIQKIMELF